jgi:hypothetical protein
LLLPILLSRLATVWNPKFGPIFYVSLHFVQSLRILFLLYLKTSVFLAWKLLKLLLSDLSSHVFASLCVHGCSCLCVFISIQVLVEANWVEYQPICKIKVFDEPLSDCNIYLTKITRILP